MTEAHAATGNSAAPLEAEEGVATADVDSLQWLVSLPLRIRTKSDQEFLGRVFAVDSVSNTVALYMASSNGWRASRQPTLRDFEIIRISSIRDFTVLSAAAADDAASVLGDTSGASIEQALSEVGTKPISLQRVAAREAAARRAAAASAARRGADVTEEAQSLFDYISRTLPCRWQRQSIVVLDAVRIDPPYRLGSIAGDPTDPAALTRVKRMVRLGDRDALTRIQVEAFLRTPSDGRKGG